MCSLWNQLRDGIVKNALALPYLNSGSNHKIRTVRDDDMDKWSFFWYSVCSVWRMSAVRTLVDEFSLPTRSCLLYRNIQGVFVFSSGNFRA